jgi:hypothetical protein
MTNKPNPQGMDTLTATLLLVATFGWLALCGVIPWEAVLTPFAGLTTVVVAAVILGVLVGLVRGIAAIRRKKASQR